MRISATLLALGLSSALVAAVAPPPDAPPSPRPHAAVAPANPATPVIDQRPADRARFTLAVLRRDGVVIPFAHYDGRKWSNSWVVPTRAFEVPLSLQDVPDKWWPERRPITEWTAWPTQRSSRRVETQGPVLLRAHCQRTVGLRTNFVPAEPPPPDGVQPYPKEGLATTGPLTVEPVQLLNDTAPEWKMVVDSVRDEVTRREREAIGNLSGAWRHPVPENQRAGAAFEPEVVLRGHDPVAGLDVYYFEGVKRYPTKPREFDPRRDGPGGRPEALPLVQLKLAEIARIFAPGPAVAQRGNLQASPQRGNQQPKGCELLTFASGWLMVSPGRKPALRVSVDITDCNREGLVYTLPLGAIRLNGRLVWILQVSGYGYERYEVVAIENGKLNILLAAPGGACG